MGDSHAPIDVHSLNPAQLPLSSQLITGYTFVILLFCAILLVSAIFIELVACVSKKVMDRLADYIFAQMSNDVQLKVLRSQFHHSLHHVQRHQLIDRTCPVSSHTPSEVPPVRTELSKNALSESIHSSCNICNKGIRIGEMSRILPCGHVFHARCIDSVVLANFRDDGNVGSVSAYIECPSCSHVIFPTPDLIRDTQVHAISRARNAGQNPA